MKDDEGVAAQRGPLTNAELTELRGWVQAGATDTTMPVSFLAPRLLRLLDEVVASRREKMELAVRAMKLLERLDRKVSYK